MYKHFLFALLVIGALFLGAPCSHAQSAVLKLPRASQRAEIVQRVGITDITINYHRPLTNGRPVWGKLVPYGQVWRAGANENTTIEFTDPVTIDGKPLPKGFYGLHTIPGENEWIIIFSKNATSWGSFTYNQAEDALRVTVKPQPAEFHDALTYDFDDLKPDSTVVTLRWDKLAVPFKIGVNVPEVVEQSLHDQVRGRAKYTWEGWDEAASYLLDNKGNLQDALKDADESVQFEERFENLMTKSRALDALGRKEEATAARKKAIDMGNAIQIHVYARQLQRDGHQEQAFEIYRVNSKKFPDNWLVHSEVARMAVAKGDFDTAVKEMQLCLASAPEQQKPQIEGLIKRLQAKDDINK
jgi:tetratricopeptide (TPR) repeat protein